MSEKIIQRTQLELEGTNIEKGKAIFLTFFITIQLGRELT